MQSDSQEIIFNVIEHFFSLHLTRQPAGCCCDGVLLDVAAVWGNAGVQGALYCNLGCAAQRRGGWAITKRAKPSRDLCSSALGGDFSLRLGLWKAA